MVENGGAKDLIVTCDFLRTTAFFIKLLMWHRNFSISFAGSKFNETWKTIKHLITSLFIVYVINLSTKKKMQRWRFIFFFLQKSKIQTVGYRKKKFFSVFSFQKFLIFHIFSYFMIFHFRKCLMFRRSIPLSNT